LAAAHSLTECGAPVTTFEKNEYVGGLCRTMEHNGFRFDLGGHRWFTKDRELHEWFLELMDGELVTVRRKSRIYYAGRYFDYPVSIRNVLANAGLKTSALAAASYLAAVVRGAFSRKEPANLQEAFTLQFGRKLFEMFFRQYSEKVWGRPCREISADWADQRSKGLSVFTAIRDAIRKRRDVVSLIDEFVYPRLGYQRICERMAEEVECRGGQVVLSAPIRSIAYRGPHDFVLEHGPPGDSEHLEATHVVSTIPLSHLVRMLEPACDAAVRKAAESLCFRALITVTVMLARERVTSDTWLYVHDEDLIFARIHEPKNWSDAMVPDSRHTSLVCECFCSPSDATWNMSDEELVDRVVTDLADRLGFLSRDDVIDSCVLRTPNAYPVYDLDYRRKLTVIRSHLERFEGLFTIGRGGLFRYNNADHSIEMGRRVARRILGFEEDPGLVNTERAYHEEMRGASAHAWRSEPRDPGESRSCDSAW